MVSRGLKEEWGAIIQWGGMAETLETNAGDRCTEIGTHLMSPRCTLKLLKLWVMCVLSQLKMGKPFLCNYGEKNGKNFSHL